MVETLKKLNEQTIKDGFLLPDNLSQRKDFSNKLGWDLTPMENHSYRIIHDSTKNNIEEAVIIPISAEDVFKSTYMPIEPYQTTDCDMARVQTLISRIRDKLGKTAIENIWNSETHLNDYYSRRKVIELTTQSKYSPKS